MGRQTDIDLNISDESVSSSVEKPDEFSSNDNPEDPIKSVPDERDYIPPIEDTGERAATDPGNDLADAAGEAVEKKADASPEEDNGQAPNIKNDPATEIVPADGDAHAAVAAAAGYSEEDLPGETLKPYDDDTFGDQVAEGSDAAADATALELQETNDSSAAHPPESKPVQAAEQAGEPATDPAGRAKADAAKPAVVPAIQKNTGKTATPKDSEASGANKRNNKRSLINKISSIAVVVLIGAGVVLYLNPSLIGLSKTHQSVNSSTSDMPAVVAPAAQQLSVSSVPSKREQFQAKLTEAIELRNQLLEKKSEIYQLDQYYRSSNAELEAEILRELDRTGVASFQAAMGTKRIELTLRTIQRRQAYIEELKKPAHWLNSGSEELYYLIRRAELDLELTEIAGGIDLNRHLRHIGAAIQKYRPGPDKLAIDPVKAELKPLEKIWEQMSSSKTAGAWKGAGPDDEIIANQVCNGNYERVAELTRVTASAATCLARMKGADLFLNGVTSLSVDAAKRLFQWQGNWICLNGVQDLSEAAARYLFKWKGNWLSLNSLNSFPPEFGQHLLKWEGQQLELMGLEYTGSESDQKMLKYLALWETTGGKLFVSEKIRRELEQLM